VRYPVVELLSALLAVACSTVRPHVSFAIYYLWACVLLIITFIDLDIQIIPDRLSPGGIVAGLVAVYWLPEMTYKMRSWASPWAAACSWHHLRLLFSHQERGMAGAT
jgi:prepilin signal peptidase PulO-like enzyme (type II secretory pathway)